MDNNGLERAKLVWLKDQFDKLRSDVRDTAPPSSVEITNLDEIRSYLHSELNNLAYKLDSKWKQISNAIEKFKYVVELPDSVTFKDFADLKNQIIELRQALENKEFSPNIDVIVPKIEVPDINVPPAIVPPIEFPDIPQAINEINIDISRLLKALAPLKFLSDKASSPISVRLSDGKRFIQALKAVADKTEKVAYAFATQAGMTADEFDTKFANLNYFGTITSGVKALADATTAAQVDSTAVRIRGIEVSALNGRIAVGDSSVRMDSGNERGLILYPGNNPVPIKLNNLSLLYAAGAVGTKLCYAYYS